MFNRLVNAFQQLPGVSAWWLLAFLFGSFWMLNSCSEKRDISNSNLILKTGVIYASDGSFIAQGGKIRIGLLASGGGVPLTYVKIERKTLSGTSVEVDKGLYADEGGYDEDFVFSKDSSAIETWVITVMNADRDTAIKQMKIYKAAGSAYGDIHFHASLNIGFQDNDQLGHFLDADEGVVYDDAGIQGHEGKIDVLGYYYVTSGLPSPSLTCPGYTAAIGFYPGLGVWPVRQNILYDYASTDNNLVTEEQFDGAVNDSLLVSAYKPAKVSGNCKYCYTGKIIPFKTQEGKYGLIKVIRADQMEDGSMEVAIKVQK